MAKAQPLLSGPQWCEEVEACAPCMMSVWLVLVPWQYIRRVSQPPSGCQFKVA